MTRTRPRKGVREPEPVHDRELISTLLEFTAEYHVDRIMRLIVDKVPRLVHASGASVFWLDQKSNRIVLRDTYLGNRHNIGRRSYKVGEGLTGWVAKTGRPLRVKNLEDEAELRRIDPDLSWSDKYSGFSGASREARRRQRAFLAVPIKIEGVTMGVLRIAKTDEPDRRYTKQHEDLLMTFAEQLSTILKNAEILQRAEEFDALIKHEFFNNPEAMDAYLKWAADLIPTILGADVCSIFLRDEEEGSSYVLSYTSKGNPLGKKIGQISYRANEGLTGWVLFNGESVRVNNLETEEELRHKYRGVEWAGKRLEFKVNQSYFMAAPIKTPRVTYGVIRLAKKAGGVPFTKEDERLLNKYGNFLGASLRSFELEQNGTMMVRPKWAARYPTAEKCCFVLMPFSQPWSKKVRKAIREAVAGRGLDFRIGDESTDRDIMQGVWRGICEARIVIADLSAGNPNVAYEVGMTDVVGKDIVLLAQDPSAVPINFAGARLLVYNADNLAELKSKLGERITQILSLGR